MRGEMVSPLAWAFYFFFEFGVHHVNIGLPALTGACPASAGFAWKSTGDPAR
jgi:hypothetical protein